jgi:hypothetical protein
MRTGQLRVDDPVGLEERAEEDSPHGPAWRCSVLAARSNSFARVRALKCLVKFPAKDPTQVKGKKTLACFGRIHRS